MNGMLLTPKMAKVGLQVVALAELTSEQGWSTGQGTLGRVKVAHPEVTYMNCAATTSWPVKTYKAQKKDLHRRQGKGRRCCLGDNISSIPCRASCSIPK